MASEAQIKQAILDKERAKTAPDNDIIYALEISRPYWNTVDRDRLVRGQTKVNKLIN